MSLHLDLLRHGETTGGSGFRGSTDDALTDKGWAQMHQALSDVAGWDLLISSPLQRCRMFAEQLAAARKVPLRIEADLRELHFGEWEGRNAAEILALTNHSAQAEVCRKLAAGPWLGRGGLCGCA